MKLETPEHMDAKDGRRRSYICIANLQEGLRPVHVWITERRGGIRQRLLMGGAPVAGILEGYGARRLSGGCGGGGPAAGQPAAHDRERRRRRGGRARRRAVTPVRGTIPPLVGHGSE